MLKLEPSTGGIIDDDESFDHDEHCDEAASRSVVGRVATIISAFDEENQMLTLNDLCHRTALPKSTVHRFAEQLRKLGWLEREGTGYRVGIKLFEVGGLASRRNRLRDKAFPHLQMLAAKTGFAVQLGILDQGQVLYLDRIPMGGFNLPTRDGGRMPAYCTGLGKSMLAFDSDAAEVVAAGPMPRRTAYTIGSASVLHEELSQIRVAGVAFDREEAYNGLVCAAAPIRNSGRAIAAVSVTGPVARADLDVMAACVRTAAAAIWQDRFGGRHG